MKKIIFLSAIALMLFATLGCDDKLDNNTITQEAKIIYDDAIDSCGDVYMVVIRDEKGIFNKQYKPNNLSDEYKKDGINVKITYSLTSDYHNCGFGGKAQIIKIHDIKKIIK